MSFEEPRNDDYNFLVSDTELLQEIERLPEARRRQLVEQILLMSEANVREKEETAWSRFSATELLAQYGPADSIYDRD